MQIEILTDFDSPVYGPRRAGQTLEATDADAAAFIRAGRAREVAPTPTAASPPAAVGKRSKPRTI